MANIAIKSLAAGKPLHFPFSAPCTPSIYLDICPSEISDIVKGKEQKEGSIGPYLWVTCNATEQSKSPGRIFEHGCSGTITDLPSYEGIGW